MDPDFGRNGLHEELLVSNNNDSCEHMARSFFPQQWSSDYASYTRCRSVVTSLYIALRLSAVAAVCANKT